MNTLEMTEEFEGWLDSLNEKTQSRIYAYLSRLEANNFGSCKSVGDGVSELRMDFGPGYRAYFGRTGNTVYLLLTGGDKGSQDADIARAKRLWASREE